MAVKVMVAPAIANGEIDRPAHARRREATAPAKPKRRRSSVYDAEGNEVFITLMCLKCHKMRPLSQFGLRKMADGAIRNQPWCRACRSASGAEKLERKGSAETMESVVAAVPSADSAHPERSADAVGAESKGAPAPIRRPASSVATEVAAALAAGLRR